MARKISLSFMVALLSIFLSISCLLLTEAKPFGRKNSDSLYIYLDLKDPSKISFEFSLINKINLKGECNAENKSLKIRASIKDFDLTQLGEYIELPVGGYIKKGNIDIEAGEIISLEGELEATKLKLTKKDICLKGDVKLLGYLKFPKQGVDYSINYRIKDGYFSKLKDIKEIHAKGFLKKDKLFLSKAGLIYKGLSLEATGQVEDFSSPKIDLKITSALWDLKVKARRNGEILEVSEFLIEGKDTEINAQASIGINKPRADIQGEGYLSLRDVIETSNSLALKTSFLINLNPQGRLNVKFTLAKEVGQKKGEIKLNCTSEELEIKGAKVKNIKIGLLKKGNELTISPFLAEVSGGKINLTGMLNLSNNMGSLNLTANGIDIAQVMHELNVEGKKPRGKLSLEANLRSVDLFKWKELSGEGKILISEGNIYQINFLKGLGKFLFIPDFGNIVFKRAYSGLLFEGENIFFENFQLSASQMSIEGKGKITTAGNIDFLLFPQFSQKLIGSSKGLQKYLTAFLGGIFSVSISGTVKNPVYTANISIIPDLDKIEDIIDIFKDIF